MEQTTYNVYKDNDHYVAEVPSIGATVIGNTFDDAALGAERALIRHEMREKRKKQAQARPNNEQAQAS